MLSTAGNVLLSDEYRNEFYGYTWDGQLVYWIPIHAMNFVVEPFQRMFSVFQRDTWSFLAARTVLAPFQFDRWYGCLELSTIYSISGNLTVNISVESCGYVKFNIKLYITESNNQMMNVWNN